MAILCSSAREIWVGTSKDWVLHFLDLENFKKIFILVMVSWHINSFNFIIELQYSNMVWGFFLFLLKSEHYLANSKILQKLISMGLLQETENRCFYTEALTLLKTIIPSIYLGRNVIFKFAVYICWLLKVCVNDDTILLH